MGLRDVLAAAMVRHDPLTVIIAGMVTTVYVQHLDRDTVTLLAVAGDRRYYVDPQQLVVVTDCEGH